MKVIENTEVFPPYNYYTDVEEKFLKFTPECRVLPARYYYSAPTLNFILRKRFEPGTPGFPQGGFEVFGPDGGVYNFMLNEVIVHPFQLGMRNYFSTAQNVVKDKVSTGPKGKRGRPKIDPSLKKTPTVYVPTGGKRGRKPLSPEEKAQREAEKANKPKGTGKKGRPKKQIF